MENQTVVITLELVNKVVSYLGTRPYQEVFQLINEFGQAAQVSLGEVKPEGEGEEK